ncbi:hypothetical protein PRZ48_007208 [Zasmidium cellare]|uniref:Uncharacterized protein n=1 Tax=Zasmidium cellare TaxID=395010 RepID=A0ABR0EIQ9_ZASCE|nr:hypothetical protein PRZ48_007208 [Zasmidium cellare]
MPPPPYTLPALTSPSFPTHCPAPSARNPTQRCRNKRSCDLRRKGGAERVRLLTDDLVLCWEVLSERERFAAADGVARGSVCSGCERRGLRGWVREGVLRGLREGEGRVSGESVREGVEGGSWGGGEKVWEAGVCSTVVEESVVVRSEKREGEEAGCEEERKHEAFPTIDLDNIILIQPETHHDDQQANQNDKPEKAAPSTPLEKTILIQREDHHDFQTLNTKNGQQEATPSTPPEKIILIQPDPKEPTQTDVPQQDSAPSTPSYDSDPFQLDLDDDDRKAVTQEVLDLISSTPPSARTTSTRHSSPPTDFTINSSPPDLPPGPLAEFCFQTSGSSDLPSTPQEPLWTGPVHAVEYFPSPRTPSRGPKDEVAAPESPEVQHDDLAKVRALELENAHLREQLQDLRRDLDTAQLKTRAARAEADRWRKLYTTLKECVLWFFEREEVVEEGPRPEAEDEDWSSEAEQDVEEVYWPLKVPKKREAPGSRVDSGLGSSIFGEEVELPPVPTRRRRRTTGISSLGSIVEEMEEEEQEEEQKGQ